MTTRTRERFSKADRILKRDTFKKVYQDGRKFHSRYFTAFVLANPRAGSRIGITTTRKVGNAVERNRARRLVREAFRRNKWLAPPAVDIVINVKRALVEARYTEFEAEFVSFLKRLVE
jgi:ribonuclease P protein component